MSNGGKAVIDTAAIGSTFASIFNILPDLLSIITGILTVIWMTLRIKQTLRESKKHHEERDNKKRSND